MTLFVDCLSGLDLPDLAEVLDNNPQSSIRPSIDLEMSTLCFLKSSPLTAAILVVLHTGIL